ncbi:ATP(GTP)-binding protein Fet5 [Ceratobasidium sp. AG-Ba]|nr:ATP(GTP)-binding protein Fet5 [Ceratobasidium sp. AG-Ba]
MSQPEASSSTAAAPTGSPVASDKKPPITIITIGMAGSGKTTFVQRITSYLRSTPSPVTGSPRAPYVINLDPAVANVPFEANIDIRDTVDYREVMKQYNLGPNGGILTSLNLFTTKFDQVLTLVEKRAPEVDYIILDTPGQIEIFTWSASGAILTDALAAAGPACLVYVVDTPRCSAPATFMSNMLYACSILYKTRLPFILVFNKTDVTPHDFAVEWMSDFEAFQAALASREHRDADGEPTYMSSLMNSMSLVLDEFYRHLKAVGVSSATGAGVADFFKAVDEAREEYETQYKPELERLKKERDDKAEGKKKDSIDRLMKDLAVDRERAQGPNAHWTGRENPYMDRWDDAGDDDDDEPVMQFRGSGGFSARKVGGDDGEIDDDENREYDVDADDDIIDRDDDVDPGMRENLQRASRGLQGGITWPRPG